MNITGKFRSRYHYDGTNITNPIIMDHSGAFYGSTYSTQNQSVLQQYSNQAGAHLNETNFDASKSWTGKRIKKIIIILFYF